MRGPGNDDGHTGAIGVAAGCPTAVRDPPWRSAPCASLPRPLPCGNFPSGVTFRLPTPKRVGIGVIAGEFEPPEQGCWAKSSAANGRNFSRGHRFFDHYSDMQQRAALLVPALPQHSRVDELRRVWGDAALREDRRQAILTALDLGGRRRTAQLGGTRRLMHASRSTGEVARALRSSCSAPDAPAPRAHFGGHAPAVELLNRHVDVNRLRAYERAKLPRLAAQQRGVLREKEARLDQVVGEIAAFESAHLKDEADAMRTTADWGARVRPAAAPASLAACSGWPAERCGEDTVGIQARQGAAAARAPFVSQVSWASDERHSLSFEVA